MKSKLFTLTVTMIALMGLSLLVSAQVRKQNNAPIVSKAPVIAKAPNATTYLKCEPYNKEMNQKIFLTNNTANVIKKGTVVKYTISGLNANLTLASDLAVNATITPTSVPYQGQPSCKAWF